ncbi:MAG: EamA family transporter [Sphingobacteriales bacterium]|nr:MAG: EamA family transporter [Sphingobacteriales bacterium]
MSKGKHTKAYIALIFICIVWGTTYLAIRVGVMHYPAFLFAGVRQVISGLIIMSAGYLMSRHVDISWKSLRHQALVGFLLITIGNGLVTWAEKYIPSGVAALICSLMPICSVLFNLVASKKEKMNALVITGMLFGFGGVGLIFRDNIADLANGSYLMGIAATFTATSCWALGSIINKKRQVQTNPIFNSGMQLLFGGIFLLTASPVVDDYTNAFVWHADGFWALIYAIIFGSVLAYTAYMYALKELPVGLVSTYAYVNPLVAVILGYLILNEQLTWITALAFATIMLGVYLVNLGYRRIHKKAVKDMGDNEISALPTPNTRKAYN